MTPLAIARRAAGMTQQQAAAHLGVARGTIAAWESGQGAPTPEQVAALTSGEEAPPSRRRGRQPRVGESSALVPCPVRVTREAAAIARERGSAWVSRVLAQADTASTS